MGREHSSRASWDGKGGSLALVWGRLLFLATLQVSRRSTLLRPTAVNTILADIRQAQARGQTVVSLMRGEPDFDTPAHIVEAATRAMKGGRTRYPDNRGEIVLRQAVAEKLSRDNGVTYDPGTEILVTTGATLGIHAALLALLDEGDEVLLPDPIYDAYHSPILLWRADASLRCARQIEHGRFVLTAQAIERCASPRDRGCCCSTRRGTRSAPCFASRNCAPSPTSSSRRNLVLISDEIYEAIVYEGCRHISPAVAVGRAARAHGHREQPVEDLRDDRLARRLLRRAGADHPEHVLSLQQSSRGPATFVQDAAAVGADRPAGRVERDARRVHAHAGRWC